MHGRIVLSQQIVASDDGYLSVKALGEAESDRLNLCRPHIIGRGIDHVLGQGAGLGKRQDRLGIDSLADDELRQGLGGLGLVAIKTIAAQGPGQGNRALVEGFTVMV